jgi:hypothetical protein
VVAGNQSPNHRSIADRWRALAGRCRGVIMRGAAYAVIPAADAYKEKGQPITGSIWTFVLNSTPAGWRITVWTWSAALKRSQISHHPGGAGNQEIEGELGPIPVRLRMSDQERDPDQDAKECQHQGQQA